MRAILAARNSRHELGTDRLLRPRMGGGGGGGFLKNRVYENFTHPKNLSKKGGRP